LPPAATSSTTATHASAASTSASQTQESKGRMIPWELLDSAPVPGGSETLRLYRRGKEFSIRVDGNELMNSRGHDSEEALAELVPAVVAWNRGVIAGLAGHPLEDLRVSVREIDIARILKTEKQAYDAIMLDVDNGPDGLTRSGNDWLYTREGLSAAYAALKPSGILAVWSASPEPAFSRLLRQSGFAVEEVTARARGRKGDSRHLIWLAERA